MMERLDRSREARYSARFRPIRRIGTSTSGRIRRRGVGGGSGDGRLIFSAKVGAKTVVSATLTLSLRFVICRRTRLVCPPLQDFQP